MEKPIKDMTTKMIDGAIFTFYKAYQCRTRKDLERVERKARDVESKGYITKITSEGGNKYAIWYRSMSVQSKAIEHLESWTKR